MDRRKLLFALAWIPALGAVVLTFWTWGRLPVRIAIHFDISGAPDGWGKRNVVLPLMLALYWAALFVLSSSQRRDASRPAVPRFRIFASVALPVLLPCAYALVIFKNLNVPEANFVFDCVIGLALPFLVYLIATWISRLMGLRRSIVRGSEGGRPVGVERQHSIWLGLVGVCFIALPIGMSSALPWPLLGSIIAAIAGAYIAAMGLTGFTYRVTTRGIEIRGVLGPLAYVASNDIRSFSLENVRPLRDFGGWGIRGPNSDRAYILGSGRVVSIVHANGRLHLGADHPEALMALLNRMRSAMS